MATSLQFDEHESPALTRGVRVLLALNAAVVFLQWTVVSTADTFAALGFQDGNLLRTLWTTITYMFVHANTSQALLAMCALSIFGPRLERSMGTRGFLLFYLWCGVGAAMAHLLFVRAGLLVGATAAVLGVMYAYMQQWPREEIVLLGVLPVRAWTLVLTFVGALLGAGYVASGGSAAEGAGLASLAHLGGLAFSWLYFRTPPAASLDELRQRVSPAPDFSEEPPRAIPRSLPRTRSQQRDEVDEIVAKSKAIASQQPVPVARPSTSAVKLPKDAKAAELNRVLDKISVSGLESLSSDERAVLNEMAKHLRGDD